MQKCDTCRKACGGCSWTEWDPVTDRPRHQPVPGWDAERTVKLGGKGSFESYSIRDCPEYEADPPRGPKGKRQHKAVDWEGIAIMFENGYTIQEIMRVTGHDYDVIHKIQIRAKAAHPEAGAEEEAVC